MLFLILPHYYGEVSSEHMRVLVLVKFKAQLNKGRLGCKVSVLFYDIVDDEL